MIRSIIVVSFLFLATAVHAAPCVHTSFACGPRGGCQSQVCLDVKKGQPIRNLFRIIAKRSANVVRAIVGEPSR